MLIFHCGEFYKNALLWKNESSKATWTISTFSLLTIKPFPFFKETNFIIPVYT